MRALLAVFAATLVTASPTLYAQAAKGEGPHLDCSQAKDPKACEERRDKMKAARTQAEQACQGKAGADYRECMLKQMCAQSKDPKGCEERISKAKDSVKGARAACEGKRGAEHDECMVKQMCAPSKDPAKCEATGKERMARRERIREACKDKRGDELKSCIRANSGDNSIQK
jgi:Spy/CpxP family protein refolding chaperone